MALSFISGMTEIADADTIDNWAAYKITAGGGTPTAAVDSDLQKEGGGCVGVTPTNGKDCGITFDYYTANGSTVLNLSTTGNEVLGVWINVLSKVLMDTISAGGCYIIVCASNGVPSSSNDWAKWYVMGSDEYKEGWNYFQIDTRKTPSATNGSWSGSSLSSIYQIGIGAVAVSTFKTDWLYVDRMTYGRPIYTLEGDGATTADWSDFLSDSETEVNGLIEDVNGAYALSCGIQIGTDSQTATTTFSDATNQSLNFKRHTYYYSTGLVDALTYSDYYIFSAYGAASYGTSITLGSAVGSDAGILGGTIKSLDGTNVDVTIDFSSDSSHITALNLYGVTFVDITGSFDIGDNSSYKVFSCFFLGCSQIDPVGAPSIRNCFFIGTADADAALLWNESIDIQNCNFIANTAGAGIEMPSASGSPYTYTSLLFSGNTYDVLNSSGSAITISKSGTPQSDPSTYEGSTVTFSGASIYVTVTVKDSGGTVIQSARVMLRASDGSGPFPYQESVTIANSGTTATVTHTGHGMQNSDYVDIKGASHWQNNGIHQITYISANSYSYTLTSDPGSSPSGTITSTFVALYGLSNASGIVQTSRQYGADQNVSGWARKSTSTPLYKTGNVSDTIDSADGLSVTAVLIEDE